MNISTRLNKLSQKDKENNPKYLIDVLKSDIFYLINNYFEVAFEDVKIDIGLKENLYSIKIDCVGDRLKTMRVLPE